MLKILILSFYYPPDLCHGAFRCVALVEQLQQLINNNYEIEVITTVPNRYSSFDVEALPIEHQPGLTIKRIALPAHCSSMLTQSKAFFYFAMQVKHLIKRTDYAMVFATSSRLMTAVLGSVIARKKKAS